MAHDWVANSTLSAPQPYGQRCMPCTYCDVVLRYRTFYAGLTAAVEEIDTLLSTPGYAAVQHARQVHILTYLRTFNDLGIMLVL